jgi:hypothetical protein
MGRRTVGIERCGPRQSQSQGYQVAEMKVASGQINPTPRTVREKARQAGGGVIFEAHPSSRTQRPSWAHVPPTAHVVLGLAAVVLASCRSGEVDPAASAPPAVIAAAGAPARHGTAKPSDRKAPFASPPWRIPVGPNLVITPGKGFGPIRFGATQETIERLIGEPCEERRSEGDDVICRYSAQAVDFVLRKGKLVQMRAHRLGRPFKPEPKLDYGIFNGRFAEGVAFGMVPGAVRELLGAPKRVQTLTTDNPNHTVEVHSYDTFSLEFDRLPSDSVVLGGVILDAPKA